MFDSLDEQMKHDDALVATPRERILRYTLWVVIPVVVFGAVLLGILTME